MELSNVASERAVLAGICSYGIDCYLDVEAFLEDGTFTVDFNKVMYKCIKHTINKVDKIDFVSLLSAATDLSLGDYVNKPDVLKHFHGVLSTPIQLSGISGHAKKIRRLQFARHLQDTIKEAYKGLNEVSGEESLSDIVAMAEAPIQNASISYMKKDDNKPKLLGEGGMDYFEYLVSDEPKQVGVPSGFPSYDVAIGGGFLRKCVDLVGARTKSLRYGSFVYTKNGPVKIENLSVGDKISHPFVEDSIVEEVFDFKDKDIYRVHFRDGSFVDCCEDHLWEVYKRYPYTSISEKSGSVLSTKDIAANLYIGDPSKGIEYKWDVRLPSPIKYAHQSVPVDPYVVGVLLGDGSLIKTCTYTSMDQEIIDYVNGYFSDLGYEVKIDQNDPSKKCVSYRINGFQDKLREIGIFKHNCYTKFIPDIYKYNSEEVRLEILRGLLDTDGSCTVDPRSKTSRNTFTSASKQLIEDLCEIVTSLGGIATPKAQVTTCLGRSFDSFRCEVRLPNNIVPFKLSRKANLSNNRKIGDLKRSIVRVEKVAVDNARCIRVSNDDGLFLTDHHIVTHNCGKSVLCDNVALHVSGKLNLPVLVLDTEMSEQDHWNRIWANISGIPINEIKTGDFKKDPMKRAAIVEARDKLASIPYFYINVSGKGFDEILSIARRWVLKEVGFEPTGRTKDCLIIYDYFKLMDSSGLSQNVAEFQAMGFQATKLHNFCVEHDVPCLSFVQLNRDGIEKESADVISQSDRIGWLCTSFTILKEKSIDEIADDGPRNGNRKLVPVLSRHGPGMTDDGYICLEMKGELARMREIGTVRRLSRSKEFPERPPEPESGDEG
jgi:replicative DNA helicase